MLRPGFAMGVRDTAVLQSAQAGGGTGTSGRGKRWVADG
jgi:hypothetical protein